MKSFFTIDTNQTVLKIAAYYNIVLGFIISFAPVYILEMFQMNLSQGIEFWQFFGMVLGVLGLGYAVASTDPGKHWPVVFVGFLVSLMATFVFTKSLVIHSMPQNLNLILLMSSIIWIVPFYYTLMTAYEENTMEFSQPRQFDELIGQVRTSKNITLLELSKKQNVLLVVVRHFGCTFCRETVSQMAKIDKALLGKSLTPVFVHMSDVDFGEEFFSKYYDHQVHHISDPGRIIYKSLNLKRGSLYQLFGPMTWIRGIYLGIFKRHGLGDFEGDALQLGGVFVLSHGRIVYEQKANSASQIFQMNSLPEL